MKDSTVAVHAHECREDPFKPVVPPIYVSAVYEQVGEAQLTDRGTELKYGREENPTTRCLERVLAALEEGGDALAFNSGMAAISSLLFYKLKRGSKLLLPLELYGSTVQLAQALRELLGVELVLAWPETPDIVELIESSKPDVVFVESVTNPTLRVIDVAEVSKACEEVGCDVVVDNTFATPLLLKPLKLGARFVVHSLTKYIAGHNDVVGGAVVAKDGRDLVKPNGELSLWDWRRLLGGILQPLEAYLVMRGAKTLEPRLIKASSSALKIAERLAEHPAVERVHYPGLPTSPYKKIADKLFSRPAYGAVVSFEVKGGKSAALSVLKKVKLIRPSPSLGGTESLLTYPVLSASRSLPEDVRIKLGITDGLLRLSVGLEDPEDLIEDLEQALK